MKFAASWWLSLVPVLLCIGAWLWFHTGREFHRRLGLLVAARFYTPLIEAGVLGRLRLRLWLTLAALLALVMALARPLGGLTPQAAQRRGVNLIIAVDGSRSMLADDVAPSRFAQAQQGIDRLLARVSGDRVGLMLFGGQATLVAPLTFDAVSLRLINRGLDPEWVGRGGSSLGEVIARAAEFFRKRRGQACMLLLVSDGEETEGDAVVAAQEAYRKDGLRIFTVGVGTAAGAAIPELGRDLARNVIRTGTVHDAQGREVRSRLDERTLRAVAEVAGGSYLNLVANESGLDAWYDRSLRPLAAPMEETPLSDYDEWFQLPLLLALVLLIAEALAGRKAPTLPGVTKNATVAVLSLVLGLMAVRTPLQAVPAEAQRLLAGRKNAEAFLLLQDDLLKSPDDPLTRYNYALGAYAAGKYGTAIATFGKLVAGPEPALVSRCQWQLGNSLYRSGEEMRATNPEGAVEQWGKAITAYRSALELPAAVHNHGKVRADLLSLLGDLARRETLVGDAAARLSRDRGVPAWRTALAHYDRALKIAGAETESSPFAAGRAGVAGKIYAAFMETGRDQQRRAQLQKPAALERAIELTTGALEQYVEALAARAGDPTATAARDEAAMQLDPWRVELADRQHAQGETARPLSLEDAISFWRKAADNYARVLGHAPGDPGALAGKRKNDRVLHDGYVELGDRKQIRAAEPGRPTEETDALFEQALDHYEAALALEPANAATKAKLQQVGVKLTEVFVVRGQRELAAGRARAAANPTEAIASLERAVQSFTRARQFTPGHPEATAGKAAAEELLKQLRDLDAQHQRKVLGKGDRLKDPQDLEDPGNLALKLLDYDNEHLAARKQQNYTAPENKPLKDW